MRVVIADDEVLFREGLERLLIEAGFEVVGKVGTAAELRRKVEVASPHVAIVDIKMPPTHTDEGPIAVIPVAAESAPCRKIALVHPTRPLASLLLPS